MSDHMVWHGLIGRYFHLAYYFMLVFLVFSTNLIDTRGQELYITPSSDSLCPQQPCSTLSELAANINLSSNSDITILFLPGIYLLDHKLILSDANNISITNTEGNVIIKCSEQSVRFEVSRADRFLLRGLQFFGCGGNLVTQVNQFILQNTTFHGLENIGTALILNDTSMAYIKSCTYFNNTMASIIQELEVPEIFTLISNQNNNITVGGAIIAIHTNVVIDTVIFMENSAQIGTAIFAGKASNVSVSNSQFIHETSTSGFGVLTIDHNCNLHVNNSTFSNNTVGFGVISSIGSAVSISDGSTFVSNSALFYGGAVLIYNSSLYIYDSTFVNNTAPNGGVVGIFGGSCYIGDSIFTDNRAAYGGVIFFFDITGAVDEIFHSSNNQYMNNQADILGGVMHIMDLNEGLIHIMITYDNFMNNIAKSSGGVIFLNGGLINIADTNFSNNVAELTGGVIVLNDVFLLVNNTNFSDNKARIGSTVYGFNSQIALIDSSFENNNASVSGVVYLVLTSVNTFGMITFLDNFGSLNLIYCNITFNGSTKFQNSMKLINSAYFSLEGGAITSILSTIFFAGTSSLIGNEGGYGGALLAIESTISISGKTVIANNTATFEGGGFALYQSRLEIKRNCSLWQNNATMGGGIHATGSTIVLNQPAGLHLLDNEADIGGGISLTGYTRLNLLMFSDDPYSGLIFSRNHATIGGALYVDDDSYSNACSINLAECFIQSFILDPQLTAIRNPVIIYFSDNTAVAEVGANIFGGLLNKCSQSPIVTGSETPHSGITYISEISNISLDSISSLPVQVCFCNNQRQPVCNYQQPAIQVMKGEKFSISLVAVDQVENPVEAFVTGFLSSEKGGVDEGQQTQEVRGDCTDLTFNVFSPSDNETLNLFAQGPCGNSELSLKRVNITFTTCTCPIGFQPSNSTPSRCECICDSSIMQYITDCNISTSSLNRIGTNSWISYVNISGSHDYVIEPICPYDYCRPPTEVVMLNLNLPDGANAQCANNRSGVLCGACGQNFSLSLGSTKCITCEYYWPAVFVAIILVALIAGILLVTALLALNITVAGGQINVFIFYANIIAASRNSFFSFSESNFPAVFIAWLNLDIGFDVCFIDGLDAYVKTWLQLAFPVYIISLVFLVIMLSNYSPRFANLIGKRDPVATLATLVLLSYTKLLSTSILVFSYTTLMHPNQTRVTVWLPDGNVRYYEVKRIIFVVVAFILIFIGFVYTILLFSWQWLIRAPRWKMLQWTKNTKLNSFIATYHAPYNNKYRYWSGLLLIVRVIVYITAAFTVSDNPQVPLLATIILLVGLFLLKEVTGMRVYRKLSVDVVETIMYSNLLVFAAFSLYDYRSNDSTKRIALSYISTISGLILLVGILLYPLIVLFKNKFISGVTNKQTAAMSDINRDNGVTFSSVDIPYLESAIFSSSN